jgi:hypothetical protein
MFQEVVQEEAIILQTRVAYPGEVEAVVATMEAVGQVFLRLVMTVALPQGMTKAVEAVGRVIKGGMQWDIMV